MKSANWDTEQVQILYNVLTEPLRSALQVAESLARERNASLYLIGGVVRDYLLDRTLSDVDLDLVVEADAMEFARLCGERLTAAVVEHPTFRTATVHLERASFDLVTARRESYPHAGSLPVVQASTVDDDIARRDFTVNALAIRLVPEPTELIDRVCGIADMEHGLIRVLHEDSFRDDATRMLRATRYAAQLGFHIETQTERLLRRDLPFLDRISGIRIFHELQRTLRSPDVVDAMRRCQELAILRAIHPSLRADESTLQALAVAKQRGGCWATPEALLCMLVQPEADSNSGKSVANRLALPGGYARALTDYLLFDGRSAAIDRPALRPSTVTTMLARFSPEALAAWEITHTGAAADHVHSYLTAWRGVHPSLTGDDIVAMGVPTGPLVGRLLHRLRTARLDGLARDRADEIALIESELAGSQSARQSDEG